MLRPPDTTVAPETSDPLLDELRAIHQHLESIDTRLNRQEMERKAQEAASRRRYASLGQPSPGPISP